MTRNLKTTQKLNEIIEQDRGITISTNSMLKSYVNIFEKETLIKFIQNNRKTPILSIQDWWYKSNNRYYWEVNKITPRIHWIKYQIKRLNSLQNENK